MRGPPLGAGAGTCYGCQMLADTEELRRLYEDHIDRLVQSTGTVLVEHGLDALVISAGTPTPKSPFDDQDHPFRPTPAFAHWVPLREPDSAVVIEPGKRPRLVRARAGGFWDAPPRVESHHIWRALDVVETPAERVAGELPSLRRAAFIGDDPARARAFGFPEAAINPAALVSALHALRVTKSDYERACMAEAGRVAATGHVRLGEAFAHGGRSELALHLLYLEATGQDDPDTPYKNIVAQGENAATLHHVGYDREPRSAPSTSLLVDAGATCLGYASDVTRTWVRGEGGAADAFAELVRRIDALQQTLVAEITPGTAFEALHDRAHELLAEVLCDMELASAEPHTLVENGVTRSFFPHGLGHGIGVQVHDVGHRPHDPRPDNPFLRNTRVIEAGQVFTIEPGCYFIPSLMDELRARPAAADVNWSAIDALRRFGGVRVEDDVAVTDEGARNLTRPAMAELLSSGSDRAGT